MQTKNMKRAERRNRREKAIQHAFNIYWHQWGRSTEAFKYNRWSEDVTYIETNEERYRKEDEHREKVLMSAKLIAKHLRNCSCYICSGYKKYEKTRKQIQMLAQDKDELSIFD
jgi:hypothetical protein